MKTIFLIVCYILLLTQNSYSQYPRDQRLSAAEYFINTDPGEGNGIPIPGNFGTWEVTVIISNINAPVGSRIYVRFKSTNNKWSAPRCIKRKSYFENSGATIFQGEYYINNDPGYGNGTSINIFSGTVNISNLRLKRGDKVYVRIKDSFNRWSANRPVKFNFKDMNKAEYYVKLYGGGTTPVSPMSLSAVNDSSNIFNAKKNNIAWHQFDTAYVRYQTSDRFYSSWVRTGTISAIQGINVNLRVIPEGLYNTSSNILNRRDTVKAYLRRPSNPFAFVDSALDVIDSTNFSGSFTFPNALNGNYYLVVQHHNCLETWSKAGGNVLLRGTSTIYDFTTSITQAYGSNMTLRGNKYCIFSGDVNKDSIIDVADVISIYNSSNLFKYGYSINDLTGDYFVDVSDLLFTFNNANNFISLIRP